MKRDTKVKNTAVFSKAASQDTPPRDSGKGQNLYAWPKERSGSPGERRRTLPITDALVDLMDVPLPDKLRASLEV